jgi:hypothetical protein
LPAESLDARCYWQMFYGCINLTTAPTLPAKTLAIKCYEYMFEYCKRLNHIEMLATDISAENCLRKWVYGVSSAGTFIKSKDATWNVSGENGIPTGWTVQTK